ncbi:hypothetical protein NA57DRAFT_71944 [Rhizodiscina lignyota]|uniref:DUF1989 domain-containing protein n=1 Tax=Rhizodiscina lignyota TaxID=1504668 RepID=A0A9P4IPE3_9PEZI|nr:hypothetical protein NA57DRAFT_71944 [Rhizodiscina lignyota]
MRVPIFDQDVAPPSRPSKPLFTTKIVPASYGYSWAVKKGQRFRVIDTHGQQVVDFMAWTRSGKKCNLHEKVSMAYTRYHLSGATPAIGECLWTNADEPLLKITQDTVKVHDMTFMSCFPELYAKKGIKGHRSCASNIAEAMEKWGMKSYLEIADPFNIFQNTPYYSLKPLNPSKAGDYIEFEALGDCVCAVSCCPYDIEGFNGGIITDIAVVMEGDGTLDDVDNSTTEWIEYVDGRPDWSEETRKEYRALRDFSL